MARKTSRMKVAALLLVTMIMTGLVGIRAVPASALAQVDPVVGGTLIIAVPSVDTLDIHRSGDGNAMAITFLMGATLVARDEDAEFHPWLATSWETSADGLTWTFVLRQDVKFHDGTPMTAHDYAWTITRLLDPATAAGQAGRLRAVERAEAPDDYTLVFHLFSPYPLLLEQLSNTGVVQPYSQKFVEEQGDQFGQTFMGVGPYKFKEWRTGEMVVIERNPDFAWGPSFVTNQSAHNIETIEFRILPEPATIIAAIEAGDADYAVISGDQMEQLQGLDHVDIYESLAPGMYPSVHMNLSQTPFDSLQVRQALNLAVDRDALVAVVLRGHGQPQFGPISPNIVGYWPGVEEIGYHFDLERAKALMAEAGYTVGGDGILEKDGQPLALTLKTTADFARLAQVLQEQYKALGVEITIEQIESGVFSDDLINGDYEIAVTGYLATESDILYRWYHTSREGALNWMHGSDPELDRLLDLTRTTQDPEARNQAVADVQKYMVEQAWVVPLYTAKEFLALNTRVEGERFCPPCLGATLKTFLNDAYLTDA